MMVVRDWQSDVENLAVQEDVGGAEAVVVKEFSPEQPSSSSS